MKKKWLAAALAGILLAAAVLSGCASTEKAKRLRFGVAGEGGIYREFGERFAALENETDNGQVELKATAILIVQVHHAHQFVIQAIGR
mgnify:CR=1 FL=1